MLDISLIITQDLDLLENTFNDTITTLNKRGLPVHLNKIVMGNSVVFRFTLCENNAQSSFLLPLTLASSLTDYITNHRENPRLEHLIKKHSWFLDGNITKEDIVAMWEQCKVSSEKQHQQKLVFFPLVNYFSNHLPVFTCNIEGFLDFGLASYNLAIDEKLFNIINSLLCEKEKKKYQAIHCQTIKKATHLTLLKGGKT